MRPEGLSNQKIPVTPSGIEPATFQLVAQCLNHLHHHLPWTSYAQKFNIILVIVFTRCKKSDFYMANFVSFNILSRKHYNGIWTTSCSHITEKILHCHSKWLLSLAWIRYMAKYYHGVFLGWHRKNTQNLTIVSWWRPEPASPNVRQKWYHLTPLVWYSTQQIQHLHTILDNLKSLSNSFQRCSNEDQTLGKTIQHGNWVHLHRTIRKTQMERMRWNQCLQCGFQNQQHRWIFIMCFRCLRDNLIYHSNVNICWPHILKNYQHFPTKW
jgi:hypothetical protein